MNLVKPIALLAMCICIMCSCRKKEVFPDLAKQLQGEYSASQVTLIQYVPTVKSMEYNPKDSAQLGQITIRKLDALSVNVHLLLKKHNGQVLFEDAFDCELSRDIDNKGSIKLYTYGGQAGAFIVDDGRVGYNYLSVGSRTQNNHQLSNVECGFTVRL